MIITINIPKAYAEVYAFINVLGNDYINKIPIKIYNTIKNNRDINYNPQFDKNQKIQQGNISQEALSLIAALNLQYWCKNEKEKSELKQTYIENTKQEEKNSYENLFKNKANKVEIVEDSVAMIEYKESIFKKIKNWFKRLFN